MKTLIFSAALFVFAAAPRPAGAQAPPVKWGNVPDEHLHMAAYPADTNATAVVLADYGTVAFEQDFGIVFRHHRRIKILTEAGYEWGNVRLPYYAEDHTQDVQEVRGQTFTVGADGKVKRQGMPKGSVFRENVGEGYRQVRFTLPALAPGAVIEYQYTLRSKSPIFVPEWAFQDSEPVLWSEFRIEIPGRLGYVRATRGVLNFHIQEEKDGVTPTGGSRIFRFVMRDVPALREEPYMTTPENFRARLEYQLASYYDPGFGVRRFLQTWDEVAKQLMENDAFGRQIDRPRRNVRDQVEAVTAGLTDPVERMRALYDFVRTNVAFTGHMGYFLDRDLDDVLKTRTGSSPEVALLLVSMLREAGLEAEPVLISTRSHGTIIEEYPLLRQFNDVLVYVQAGGKPFLLDATDPLRPYDLLPYEALNGRGWLVRKGGAQWVGIQATGRYAHQAAITAALSEDGTLAGMLEASDGGYSALFKRRRLKDDGAEKLVRDVFLDGLDEVVLDSHAVAGADSVDGALKTQAAFTVPAYAQAAGDYLYVNPTVVDRTDENPLRLPERTFPVDFGYPSDVNYNLRLTLPEGYEVHEKPATQRLSLPNGGASFTRVVEVVDGVLVMQTRFVRARGVYDTREYHDLRAFYDRLVAAQAEPVVLKRTQQVSEGG